MATIELTQKELDEYVGLEVIKIIGPERQRELLIAAIKEVSQNYACKCAVETVVKAALAKVVTQLLEEPEQQEEILTIGSRLVAEIIGNKYS